MYMVAFRFSFRRFSICAALLMLFQMQSTFLQAQSAQTSTNTVVMTTFATTNAPTPKPSKRLPSKTLKIFFESRNVVARPEGYETLLTIEDGGAMTFEWHTVSGKRKTLTAQLKPKEWKNLLKTLDVKKFMEAQPESVVGYADWMQSLAIEKDEKERTLRMMVDYRKRTPEAVDRVIQEQLGTAVTKDLWAFISAVRTLNDRFKWSGQ
jgi:hypothetical protein